MKAGKGGVTTRLSVVVVISYLWKTCAPNPVTVAAVATLWLEICDVKQTSNIVMYFVSP